MTDWTDADLFKLTRDTAWWTSPVAEDWTDIRAHLLTLYSCAKWINWPYADHARGGCLRPPLVVEIGVRHGISSIAILHAMRETRGLLVSLEMDPVWAKHAQDRIDAARLGQWWQLLVANSNDAIDTVHGIIQQRQQLIDMLWIDGAHDAEQVRRDVTNYAPLVRKNGMIAMHDYFSNPHPSDTPVEPPFPSEVSIVVEEMRKTGRYEICVMPWSHGLAMCRVLHA